MQQVKPSEEVIELKTDEKVSEELVGADKPSKLFKQDGKIFRLYNTPIHSYLRFLEKTTKKLCKEPYYKPNLIYLLEANWSEFKISYDTFRTAMQFFRDIYKEFKSECGLILMVNMEKKDWKIFVPVQEGTPGTLKYYMPHAKGEAVPQHLKSDYEKIWADPDWNAAMEDTIKEYQKLIDEGYVVYGTMHSHCAMSAFFSSVDDQDEFKNDGLHITVGNVNTDFSYTARYTINGAGWDVKDIREIINVNEVKDLHKNLNNVETPQEFFDRFIEDLDPPKTYGKATSLYQDNYSPKWQNYGTRQYGGGSYQGYQNQGDYSPEKDNESSVGQILGTWEYMIESASVRIYDKQSKNIYWVTLDAFGHNKEYFNQKRFIQLPDPEIPKNIKKLMKE